MKDADKWNVLQTVFLVMCANGLLPRSHPIDATHAHNAAVFHLVVSVTGFMGLLWVQKQRRRAAAVPPGGASPLNPLSPDGGGVPHVSVTYNSTQGDRWRCSLYSLFGRWQMLAGVSVVPVLLSLQIAPPLFRIRPLAGVIALLFVWGIYFGFLLLVIGIQILIAVPRRDSQRICQSMLRPDGYFVITPERSAFYQWAEVKELREHDGDLYFWRGFGEGSYVPTAAFSGDRQAAREYFQIAHDARAGRDVQWPEQVPVVAAPHDPTVWPPPPQRF